MFRTSFKLAQLARASPRRPPLAARSPTRSPAEDVARLGRIVSRAAWYDESDAVTSCALPRVAQDPNMCAVMWGNYSGATLADAVTRIHSDRGDPDSHTARYKVTNVTTADKMTRIFVKDPATRSDSQRLRVGRSADDSPSRSPANAMRLARRSRSTTSISSSASTPSCASSGTRSSSDRDARGDGRVSTRPRFFFLKLDSFSIQLHAAAHSSRDRTRHQKKSMHTK